MTGVRRRQAIVRKPKQSRAKATVSAILQAAAQILAKDGWEGFNTNVVASRAGVSIGSLYEYFPNKQALVDAIADSHVSRGEALLVEAASSLPPGAAPHDIVKLLVRSIVALHEDDPRLHRALSSQVPISASLSRRIEKLRAEAIAFLAEALDPHIGQNRVAAQLLFDVADAVVHRWFVEDDGTWAEPERLAEQLQLMMRAYLDRLG